MQEISNLISNLGFPIVIVLGLGFALYKLALLYMSTTKEREIQLMENNKEVLKVLQNITVTIEKLNEKIDTVLEINKKEETKQ